MVVVSVAGVEARASSSSRTGLKYTPIPGRAQQTSKQQHARRRGIGGIFKLLLLLGCCWHGIFKSESVHTLRLETE
jgi:hypothetical protein